MQTLTWSLLHLPPRGAAAGAPDPRAAAYCRGDLVPCLCPSGPGTHRGHSLFSADQDLSFAHSWQAPWQRARGDSRTGELGNVRSCEWLGAPWREAPLGETPRCTSEGGAGRPAHLAGTRLQDDPRGLYTLLSPLTAPILQLQFTVAAQRQLRLSCLSGLGQYALLSSRD